MRNVTFLIASILLSISWNTNAQFKITPHAGISVTKAHSGVSSGAGVQIGVDVRYSFNGQDKGWGVQSGLYYQQQMYISTGYLGYNYQVPGKEGTLTMFVVPDQHSKPLISFPKEYDMKSIDFIIGKHREDYLMLPVMVQYAWKFMQDIRFHVSAGGYVAYQITDKINSNYTNVNADDYNQVTNTEYNYRSGLHSWDMGFICQAGVEVKRFAFLINYQTNLYHRSRGTAYNLVSFGIGYTF